jgi:hypothetical protein
MYLDFPSVEAAVAMEDTYMIDGARIELWHCGKYECMTCGKKGHKTEKHDYMEDCILRNKQRRRAHKARVQRK